MNHKTGSEALFDPKQLYDSLRILLNETGEVNGPFRTIRHESERYGSVRVTNDYSPASKQYQHPFDWEQIGGFGLRNLFEAAPLSEKVAFFDSEYDVASEHPIIDIDIRNIGEYVFVRVGDVNPDTAIGAVASSVVEGMDPDEYAVVCARHGEDVQAIDPKTDEALVEVLGELGL